MTTSEEAVETTRQHTQPCHDCPFRRNAIAGWLGEDTPESYVRMAHQDTKFECHTTLKRECAGAAIYRRNVAKLAPPGQLKLPADREAVFSSPVEFIKHHSRT